MKRMVLGLLILAVIAGAVSANELVFGRFNNEIGHGLITDFGFNINGNLAAINQSSLFDARYNLNLLADGSSGVLTESPFLAGLLNIPFGLWSWLNKDWVGGGVTVGLYFLGFILQSGDIISFFVGGALLIVAPIYGFFRGIDRCGQIKKGLADAINDNPLYHITAVALPDGKGGAAGALMYSLSW